jgi:hypothetical protein
MPQLTTSQFSTSALKSANNVMFGVAFISIFAGLFVFGSSGAPEGAILSDAISYSWGAFITMWVVTMLVGFVADILKRDGPVLRWSLLISLGTGAVHFALWPIYLLSRL